MRTLHQLGQDRYRYIRDGNTNGTPGEYGDGPDLDGNGIPDEIGINPDSLQAGYPDYPDPTGLDANAGGIPNEYGAGQDLGANWMSDGSGIDPYALQQPAYPEDPSSSRLGGPWDPYGGSSDPYGTAPGEALQEEVQALPDGVDPSAFGSF
jgi:hypothetical protein